MKRLLGTALVTVTICAAFASGAGEPVATAQPPTARPRQAPPSPTAAPSPGATPRGPADVPKFTSEAKWLMAGYNNNEVVYTILVTNLDPRIIRCTTEMRGFYLEDGHKLTISDRQVTTVFPNQPTQVGNWMDMDEPSGASYTVTCKPA